MKTVFVTLFVFAYSFMAQQVQNAPKPENKTATTGNQQATQTAVTPSTTQQAVTTNPATTDQQVETIKWMTWPEMQTAQKTTSKKVLVDFYTTWCGWCKKYDAITFKHPEIVKYVNENFYAVKFNAESKETYTYKNKSYAFVSDNLGPHNTLASTLLNNQMSYPTLVFLDDKQNVIIPLAGYMDAKSLEPVVNYIGSDAYKTQQLATYKQSFEGKVATN